MANVTYKVKDQLDALDKKLDQHYDAIMLKLDTKASARKVSQLSKKVRRLSAADAKRTAVEGEKLARGQSVLDRQRWLIPTILSAVYTSGALLSYFKHW